MVNSKYFVHYKYNLQYFPLRYTKLAWNYTFGRFSELPMFLYLPFFYIYTNYDEGSITIILLNLNNLGVIRNSVWLLDD